jgi:hypothetical protein
VSSFFKNIAIVCPSILFYRKEIDVAEVLYLLSGRLATLVFGQKEHLAVLCYAMNERPCLAEDDSPLPVLV